jgi:signal transduction histidine kinase
VRAKYEYRRGALNITIEDTGAGIDSETLEHVFDRFVTNYEGEHCGTGLGLPIVKELVEQMGGVLDMSSELGKGTTAWVTIPCKLIEFDKKKEILA